MSLNTILATTPLTSTGYHLKATGTTIGNSLIWDNGTNVGIGNTNTSYTLDVSGTGRFTSTLLVSGAATFSSSVTSSFGSSGANFNSNAATTGSVNAYRVSNTTGTASFGIDNSVGGDLITGGLPYATLLQSISNTALQLGTNQTARLTITSGGNVGIGTSSPKTYASLTTSGQLISLQNIGIDAGQSFRFNNYYNSGTVTDRTISTGFAAGIGLESGSMTFGISTSSIAADNNVTITERMRITSVGQVFMNTTSVLTSGWLCIAVDSSNYNAIVCRDNGATYSTGNYYQVFTNSVNGIAGGITHPTASTVGFYTGPSDQRLKSNIKDVEESVLPLFNNAKLKTYNHIADEDETVVYKGFLAQDMVDNFPEAYGKDKEGYYMYNPTGYIPYLVKAIQEMNTKLDEQNQTIQNLQEQINILAK